MPTPSLILSLNPTGEITRLVETHHYKQIFLYVDLKNCLRSLFRDEVVYELVENSDALETIDTSILQAILLNINAWKRYCYHSGLGCRLHYVTDRGRSHAYHLQVDSEYKANRTISNSLLPIHDEKIKEVRDRNFDLASALCQQLRNVHFFYLDNLESDFIPYYLITREYGEDPDTLHLILSNDKDHLQVMTEPNVYMMEKRNGEVMLTSAGSASTKYRKGSETGKDFPVDPRFLSVAMAIAGDASDGVPGVKGIGPVRAMQMVSDSQFLLKQLGGEDWDSRVAQGGELFVLTEVAEDTPEKMKKYWKLLLENREKITRAYRLISYEQLCRFLEKNDTLNKINNLKIIRKSLEKSEKKIMTDARKLEAQLRSVLLDWQLTLEEVEYACS